MIKIVIKYDIQNKLLELLIFITLHYFYLVIIPTQIVTSTYQIFFKFIFKDMFAINIYVQIEFNKLDDEV